MDKENLDTAAFKAQAVIKENQPQTPQKNTKKRKKNYLPYVKHLHPLSETVNVYFTEEYL